jgi:Fe-S-cluster containining protein
MDELFEEIMLSQRRRLPILRRDPGGCFGCGSCCVHYRAVDVYVDDPNFEWLEENGYLEDSLEARDFAMVREVGTYRCSALEGEVGKDAHCSIYENRPEGCRKYERGADRCRTAVILEHPMWQTHN